MTMRPTTDQTHWHATVAVRVPETDGENLAAAASRRLARGEAIEAVDDVALQAIEPRLAATVVRVAVRVRVAACLGEKAVRGRVSDAPGIERVDELCRD